MSHNKDVVSTETESKSLRKVFVPNKLLECLPRCAALPSERLRWNTNEEIASFLISFDRHDEWLCCSLKTRPKNGSIILYNRKKVKYRKDGYCWKKRKDGKTTREDHMKLKVQGMECLYGCYVHSSIVPTFHRRCYWLLQNPDIVLVHYLNVPSPEDSGKCSPLVCAVTDRHSNTRWSRDDLLSQLKPMFHSMKCTVGSGDFTIEDLVQHILDRQRTKPQPRTHACLCNHGSSGANIPHRCNSTKHRIISPKVDKTETKPAPIKTHSPVPSPRPPASSSSPPPTAAIAVSNYTDHHGNLTTVALPQNALIVMAAATATSPTVATNQSANAALSRNNNNNNKPLVVATETVTLLPPLLLTPPPLPQATPSPPHTTPPSPQPTPPAFDPDAFLNSPKQGQTYGRTALAPSPASSLSSLSSMDSAPLTADPALLGADNAPLALCLELDGEEAAKLGRDGARKSNGKRETASPAPPTKVALIQSSSMSPRRHSSAPLLLVCQDAQPTNQTQPNGEHLSTNLTQPQSDAVQVKQESGRIGSDMVDTPPQRAVSMDTRPQRAVSMDTPPQRVASMDTDTVVEAGLELSFDSPFPDLISDLIGEETVQAQPTVPLISPTAPLAPPTAGVRYVVPPQPSPSTSFLPFPQPSPSPRRANITDFSPEWSYPEGGVKVLITGPWSEPLGRYSCVFDQSAVPASLIQPGVLRCYCPAHEAGLVCLQVVDSGGSVSSSVLFEYRARNANSLPSSQLDWLSLDDNQFRMSILERLEQMERRMSQMLSRDNQQNHHHHQQQGEQLRTCTALPPASPPPLPDHVQWFERRIVVLCQRMMSGACWKSSLATAAEGEGGATDTGGGVAGGESRASDRLYRSVRHRGMTLLHLAAAQGYTHLIYLLHHWRSLNSDSLDLEQEVDPLNVDHFSCTPLMWACALGHQASAELLYSWNSAALGIPDSLGRLPLAVARSRGHTRLATALEQLHTSGRGSGQNQDQQSEQKKQKATGAEEPTTGHTRLTAKTLTMSDELTTRKRSSNDQQNGLEKQHKAEENTEEQKRREEERRSQEEQKRNQERRMDSQEEQRSQVEQFEEQRKRQVEQSRSQEQSMDGQVEQIQEQKKASEEEQRMDGQVEHSQEHQSRAREEAQSRSQEERTSSEEEDPSISVDLEEPHMTLPERGDSPQPLSPLSTSPDTGLSSSSSLPSPSPFDPASSPSLSSAYSSVGPTPMDTSPPESPSDSPASLWGAESHLMEYESSAPPPLARAHSSLQQLLSFNQSLNHSINLSINHSLNHSLSENNENEDHEDLLEDDELQVDVAALAEQIIEATPERIKREDFPRGAESALRERQDLQDTWLAAYLETVDPPRRLCPPSPLSALALHRLRPPSSAAWAEFLNASANGKIERDFALLTLTDGEQRELYEAARIIQTAFRRYKGRRLKEQQDMAAAVIQRCYRKYKQLTWIALKYALYKKMTQAAILIQSKFRSYYEQKRFQQSRRAAVLIQQYYRSYKEYERKQRGVANRGSFLTKKQDQAARKIMRFLRRCRHRIKELKQSRELERRGLTT